MIELLPEYKRALGALGVMAREIGATEIAAMVDAGLAGDPNGLLRCGIAMGAVSASLSDLIGRWDALPAPEIRGDAFAQTVDHMKRDGKL